jgi:voltage-gated potassium channel
MRTYLRALSQLMVIYAAAWRDPRMHILLTLGLCVLGTGTVVFHVVEGWSWLDAAYFSTVTIATVGFGDLHPVTTVGKLFVIVYIFVGVGIFVAIFAFLSHVDLEKLTADLPDKADGPPEGQDKGNP